MGEEGGFLVVAGACAQAEEPVLATDMIKPKKADRARKGMRLAKSSALRIPRGRGEAQMAVARIAGQRRIGLIYRDSPARTAI